MLAMNELFAKAKRPRRHRASGLEFVAGAVSDRLPYARYDAKRDHQRPEHGPDRPTQIVTEQ
jgi:hypothetical protein